MAPLRLKLQLMCGAEIALGPGKAALLDAIAAEGSISAAARALGMSYRRAWQLVDVMNRCFAEKLVAAHPGGGKSAGAQLTPAGIAMLAAYRALVDQVNAGSSGVPLDELEAALRPVPLPPQD